MSYEGYSQFLCELGHYWTEDCNNTGFKLSDNICSACLSPAVWENMVNVTNGSYEEGKRIDGYVELEIKKIVSCEHCKSVLETRYEIPKDKKK